MDRDIKIKQLENVVNELSSVKGKYFVKAIVGDSEEVLFSIYENETNELLMDFAVPYGEDINSLATVLEQELRDIYIVDFTNRMKPRPVNATSKVLDFEQYIREVKFYCEWIDIFRMIEQWIGQQAS
ncbi:hypothetical protein [Clostridium butyricum]|uniref:hypothetical protein n=1 Tax=Clostridium butyricum TaxID=1492 RepID=UPI0009034FD1|nr:hypothetical protein [Clostridium butyricum]APF23893.1 hypothetical protein NPD4_2758 [Clostridium butyricum]